MENSKFNFTYVEEDGDQHMSGILSLVRGDGTLRDKPEDYNKYNGYGPLGKPQYLVGVPLLNNVEFAQVVTANRDGILAEYAEIVRTRECEAKVEAREHRIGRKTIPNEPTIILGSDTKVFKTTVVFPNGSTHDIILHDDGRAETKAASKRVKAA